MAEPIVLFEELQLVTVLLGQAPPDQAPSGSLCSVTETGPRNWIGKMCKCLKAGGICGFLS